MTLKELSRLAGVSISTVSRVVNKNDANAASEEIRNKIWDLVHQTGYIPNSSAQNLKLGTGKFKIAEKSIACVFARTPDGKTDPFFSQIFRAIEHECLKHSYQIAGIFSASDMPHIRKTSKDTSHNLYDGIIILGRYSRSLIESLKNSSPNIVYTGLNVIKDPYDQIVCNGYEAAKFAIRYLYMLGHRSIGYLGEKSDEARYRGFYDAMQELHLPLRQKHIIDTEQSMQGGYIGVKKMLSAVSDVPEPIFGHPSSFFCANDNTAVGAIKAFSEEGISIPENISIISIDNTEICQFTNPLLSSIQIPKEELGKMAVKIMIDRIEGGHRLPLKIEIPFSLVSRESCATYKRPVPTS